MANELVEEMQDWRSLVHELLDELGSSPVSYDSLICRERLTFAINAIKADRDDWKNAANYALDLVAAKSCEDPGKFAEVFYSAHTAAENDAWLNAANNVAARMGKPGISDPDQLERLFDDFVSYQEWVSVENANWRLWANYALQRLGGSQVETPIDFRDQLEGQLKDRNRKQTATDSANTQTLSSSLLRIAELTDNRTDQLAKIYHALGLDLNSSDNVLQALAIDRINRLVSADNAISATFGQSRLNDALSLVGELRSNLKFLDRLLSLHSGQSERLLQILSGLGLDPDATAGEIDEAIDKLKHASLREAISFWIDTQGESWSTEYVDRALQGVETVLDTFKEYNVLESHQIVFVPLEPAQDLKQAITRFARNDQGWDLSPEEQQMITHTLGSLIRRVININRKILANANQ